MQNPIKRVLLLFIVFLVNSLSAQDSLKVKTKSNPIAFYDVYLGFGGSRSSGWIIGGTINYQFLKHDLVTARVGAYLGYTSEPVLVAPTVAFPIFIRDERIVDYGILYGKRWIINGTSYSVSGGISYVDREHLEPLDEEHYHQVEENSIGFPFELNIKWFKKEKKVFRAYYGLIPIGRKKISFGRSVGFKFVGNISKTTYTGFAISYGFGWHKKY